MPHTLVIGMAT